MQNQLKEKIADLSKRITETQGFIPNEEATKTAYIMPWLQIMGYDIFNPLEVMPEFTADIGIKNGEKVDYAIMRNGEPAILIECKPCHHELNIENESQLLRYFNVTNAKFGILTNGIVYKFYSDMEEANIMDQTPFFQIDLSGDIDDIDLGELLKFHKQNFDVDNIRRTAEVLKNSNEILRVLLSEFATPSKEFVSLVFKKVKPTGIFNNNQREIFTPLVKSVIDQIINSKVKDNLDAALRTTETMRETATTLRETLSSPQIETTQNEIDAYNIIRAFAAETVSIDRIVMRDAKTYCAILFDDNNRKPVARLYFNNPERLIIVIFDNDNEEKIILNNINDIFRYKNRILNAIYKYAN